MAQLRAACCAGLGATDRDNGTVRLCSTDLRAFQPSSEYRSLSITRDCSHVRLRSISTSQNAVNNPKVPCTTE